MSREDTVLFALSSSVKLAEEVADCIGIPLSAIKVRHFADGEIIVEPGVSVRGKDVFIIQSTCYPVSETLMELLICIDACKRASAHEITCVIPYFGYARQDRKAAARQPITAKLVADIISVAGADRVVTFDLHAPQIAGFFDIPLDDMNAYALLGQYITKKGFDDIVVVSPDHGGATRARKLSEHLDNVPIAIIDKRRTAPNVAEAMNLIGDVSNKRAVIIDDIVDTGGSLVGAVKMLQEKGAKEVYCCATHGILSNNAVDRICDAGVKELILTNTIELPEEKKRDNITVLSVGPMISRVIEAIVSHKPVSDVYTYFQNTENH